MLRDRPMKILIADDDRISRRLMERTLQRSGYDVTTVENGLQAVEELSKPDGPRLALIDWMMPKLDGTALCREIRGRKNERYVYMVLLTANELNEDLVTGLQAGADDYLTKPCHSAELNARLHAGRRILLLEDQLMAATEAMRFKATHDALTSLWDRGAIISMLRSALSRSSREERPVSIMLCDVDHFKNINDVHGHIVGDEVLREVSSRLVGAVRSSDAVGRFGGEEFLLVLDGCSEDHLKVLAEQVRSSITRSPFSTSIGPIPVTLSAGALTIKQWDGQMLIEPILGEVDIALYQAKRGGRDQVIVAENLVCH